MLQQPTFSLIIACYNDGRYVPGLYIDRLLSSLLEQNIDKDDIEIILADDNSPLPYDNTLELYQDKLNIKKIQVKGIHGSPGHSREAGIKVAGGKWLCFADHDDFFYPNALRSVKEVIEQTHEQYIVYSDFNKVDSHDTSKVIETFDYNAMSAFNHGKFYNIENFWKPFKLHFPEGLKTCEDVALSQEVKCALNKLQRTPTYMQLLTYAWTYTADSISSGLHTPTQDENGIERGYIEKHFSDYIGARVDVILDCHNDGIIEQNQALIISLTELATVYISIIGLKAKQGDNYLTSIDSFASRTWHRMCDELHTNLAMTKVLLNTSCKNIIDYVDPIAEGSGQLAFIEWLSELDVLDYKPVVDAEEAKMIREQREAEQADESADIDQPSDRPFFSIVIACYNDGRYQPGKYLDRLLSSISRQGIEKDNLEVILSDDQSPVPFDSIIAQYETLMTIKYIKTDYNFAPGNTRAKGVTIATGEWLCFADHDDMFYDNALSKIRKAIKDKQEQHFILGDFYGVTPEGEVFRKFEQHLNWCHGKFYNRDNLWDKYGIHFIHDLKSHEDIAICTQVACVLSEKVPTYSYLHIPVYAWTDNPESISHSKYSVETEQGTREFLEVFFEDYLTSTGWIYIEQFKEHSIKMAYAIKCVLEITCYAYFYMQGFQFRRPDDFYKKNFEVAGKYVSTCKSLFNMTNESMLKAISANNAYLYYEVMKFADSASGRYIPTQTLAQWLELVSPDT